MEHQRKVAIITGGSSGIGAAVAERLASKGYAIVISYKRNKEGADSVLARVKNLGGEGFIFEGDLSAHDVARDLVAASLARYEKVDVLINNAGSYFAGDEWNGTAAVWEMTLKNNLLSLMLVSKYVLSEFLKQKSGVIVNVASRLGVLGSPDELAYGASKAAIINLSQAQAKLLAPFGRSNSISPGSVKTGYWLIAPDDEIAAHLLSNPLERFIEVGEVADVVSYLASDESRMVTGQNIVIGPGYMRR